jgi:acyl-[acyl-carrier-protein]-phospholipid O-acyltransferase/long-chain-fatty-acid--[acyl-carrier-protein] ligase
MLRCDREQLATLNVVVAGAEKLPVELIDAFNEKFGVRPVEGYGCTELSPLVSVNVPPSRSASTFQVDCREGSVGRPIPGVSAKVVDLETGADLGANQEGMLYIRGPNVMRGYLGRDDLTTAAIRDGWYITGDVAHIDTDGFIHITGRISRFSKIGGEMVPHIQIEEELNRLLSASEESGLKAVVTAIPDEKKGERLAVVHVKMDASPEDLRKGLSKAGLPNIFIPANDSFIEVDELPILGSGKLDLKALKQIALDNLGRKKESARESDG